MVILQVNGNEWHLQVTPRAGCVTEGQGATINCLNVTSKLTTFASNIQWIKLLQNGEVTVIESQLHVSTRIWSDGHQLRISSVADSDEGIYCCVPALRTLTDTCTTAAIFNLSVALLPTITTLQSNITADTGIGSTVVLECLIDFFGKPAASVFRWQRFGKNILEGPGLKYSSEIYGNRFDLIIRNITEEDLGIYSCVISNPDKHLIANKSVTLSPAFVNNGKKI